MYQFLPEALAACSSRGSRSSPGVPLLESGMSWMQQICRDSTTMSSTSNRQEGKETRSKISRRCVVHW